MTDEEELNYLKNKISMELKNPDTQQGFEIICKRLSKLEQENAELKYNLKCRDDELAESKAEINQIIERERVVPEHYLCEMIEKNKELNKKLKEDVEDVSNINIKAQNIIAELKAENKTILEDNDTLNELVDELKVQIEKMKTCSRCMSNNKDIEEYPCKNCFKDGVYTKWH